MVKSVLIGLAIGVAVGFIWGFGVGSPDLGGYISTGIQG
jgi:ABC-type nitrate/sulfonate/bicarbonate transport system permease component